MNKIILILSGVTVFTSCKSEPKNPMDKANNKDQKWYAEKPGIELCVCSPPSKLNKHKNKQTSKR